MQYNKSYAITILFHVLASTSQLSYDQGGRSVFCPGEIINLTCTINSDYHIWTFIQIIQIYSVIQNTLLKGSWSMLTP